MNGAMQTNFWMETMKKFSWILALTVLLTAGCKEQANQAQQVAGDPNLVEVSSSFAAQIKLAAVETREVSDTLRVAGRVEYDERRVARIGATVTGRVMDLTGHLGQSVQAGTELAHLHSTELGNHQLAYLKARSQVDLHSRAVERAKLLFSADVIGSAELQKRENELEVARAEQRAAADQLRVLGMSPQALEQLARSGSITSLSPVVATSSGVIVERKVARGQVVQPADALFTIADLSQVWVTAQVPEGDAGLVKAGQDVAVDVSALGSAPLNTKLIYVSDIINPETRTVTVRTELQNKERLIKPAMLATMLIQGRAQPRLVVPATAVVREDNEDHVFVKVSDNQFRLTRIKLAPEHGSSRVVLSGLKGQEQIVVEGAFHLDNERKRRDLEGA